MAIIINFILHTAMQIGYASDFHVYSADAHRCHTNGWFTSHTKFSFKGPKNHLCMVRQASEYLTTLLLKVLAQIKYVAHYLQDNSTFIQKTATCVFEPPLRA